MSDVLTKVTEIVTGLGTLASDLAGALRTRPAALQNVPDAVWNQLIEMHQTGTHAESFRTAFANGAAMLAAEDGLRGRVPRVVEWQGPHRPPGDDVVPADLRFDHVYLVSCKYLSKVLLNPGPSRLFDRLLVGEERVRANWFAEIAPEPFQNFYEASKRFTGVDSLPDDVLALDKEQQQARALLDSPK